MSSAPPSLARAPGYEPLIELASGGMGVLYVARKTGDAGFARLVVLKRVHRHLLENREFHDMLRDEARVASLVHHPNVVSVIDVVEEEGELSLVLDYVESLSLHALNTEAKKQGSPLPAPVVARILADALAGLHAAHEAVDMEGARLELIHRDVSPQNIIVGLDGRSRLIDFGIAKAMSRCSETSTGVVKGKLRYMSPEQAKRRPLDRRADVYSAGVVLYEALTGERIIAAHDEGDILVSILIGVDKVPSEVVPSLPAELDEVVRRALALDRDERFSTAAELEEALERATPCAAPRDVARIVQMYGGETLSARRAKLHELARAAAVSAPSGRPSGRSGVGSRDAFPLAPVAAGKAMDRGARRRRWLVAAAVATAACALLSLAFAIRSKPMPGERPATSEALALSPAMAAESPVASERSSAPASAPLPAGTATTSAASGSASIPKPAAASSRPRHGPPRPSSELHGNPYHPP